MTLELGLIATLLSVVIAFLGYLSKKQSNQMEEQREMKKDVQESAVLKTELAYIRKGIEEIQVDLKANEKNINHLSERTTRNEESIKQVTDRVDRLEKQQNNRRD